MKKAFPNGNSKGLRSLHFQVFGVLSLLALSTSACTVVSHRVDVVPIDRRDGVAIETPLKVHLTDGSTGLYTEGANISGGTLRGKGIFYDIALQPFPTNPVLTPVSLDTIAAMETFRDRVNRGKTAALLPVSMIGSAVAVGAGVGRAVTTGTTLDKFPTAHNAEGALVQIETDKGILMGESIDVRDDGIIVLAPGMSGKRLGIDPRSQKLRLFQYDTILALEFEKISSPGHLAKQRSPKPDELARLKTLSRFPQGLSPVLLQKLLRIHGQTALAPGLQ